ncbi:MAG TPA: glycosyltransferase family 2 protein [Smithellaceae bacterium]|nr:glycosyltransferase family 2 protein [Smithellaceae bacterium]HRV45829.1 glycosyltransferase family 2 protein [Smithellaceae bacterium]
MEKIPLSVAIITKNEEENLRGCLQSVAFAAQIVVVDSASSDATPAIAAEFGCDFYTESWHGFGPQKQIAIDRCSRPWVLVLDADERIPSETAEVIRKITTDVSSNINGFSFPRKNYFAGRWIRHAGWWPDRVVRLFRRQAGRMTQAVVHEAVEVDGRIVELDVPIEHYTESSLSRILQKIDKYSTLGAHEAFAAGKRSSFAGAFFRAFLTFVQGYIFRLGFLDGPQGLMLAVTDSVNKYFKYAKLSELEKAGRGDARNQSPYRPDA